MTIISPGADADSVKVFNFPQITVSASVKHSGVFAYQPTAASVFSANDVETARINEPKDISLSVPNFVQADYGSKMTSSIYIRGIGARMDQPSVGLYIDNVPILNKNNYDLDLFDVRHIYVLRGPQGTLYGRNTIGGVIDIHTFSPLDHSGTRLMAGYGNGNTSELKASTFHRITENLGLSAAVSHRYSDGFFTNEYDGRSADRISSKGLRLRAAARFGNRWTLENTAFSSLARQNGFAYALYNEQTGKISPINHNDPCTYDRFNFINGLTMQHNGENLAFSSTTSYQHMDDKMVLDQDFRPISMFTLEQTQTENALTQEFVLRAAGESRWQWITGAFGFYRHLNMSAPVLFKRDGIDQLIVDNANRELSGLELAIAENSFTINSDFTLPAWGMSLYHQSTLKAGRWSFTVGLRADLEHTSIDYRNSSSINYRTSSMEPGSYRYLPVKMQGSRSKSYFELMPKLSALYAFTSGNAYISASRGYKAGGYNTQIFSDILQEKMISNLINDLDIGIIWDRNKYNVSQAISYKPEYSWNYEVGSYMEFMEGRLELETAVFYIDLRDQQLTVFPKGQTTGRLMSNAGRSRSFGVEVSSTYRNRRLSLSVNYGYVNAKFVNYKTGDNDFAGNFIPYVPQNTVSLSAGYRLPISNSNTNNLRFNVSWQGAGNIYWNEENSIRQDFYSLLNASATAVFGKLSLGLWGRNLTGTDYNTFYFKSVGNSFVQRGRPLQFGMNINLTL